MKICDNCGAYNGDDRFFCVDCDEKLGDPLSSAEEQRLDEHIGHSVEAMYNRQDPLYVSKLDKILGAGALVGALGCLTLLIIGPPTPDHALLLWLGMVAFLVAVLEALFPKVVWALEKIRLSFIINGAEDAEPSGYSVKGRKISVIFLTAIGASLFVITLTTFR